MNRNACRTSHPTTRRAFVGTLVAAGSLATAPRAFAQPARVGETDEQAIALAYKHDTTQVDAAKHPKHAASQRCNNCSLWQGKPADEWAGCAMFGRKQVANAGWCQVWAKAPG